MELYRSILIAMISSFTVGLLITLFIAQDKFCWVTCLPTEVSCLATTSFTFGLVPATALAASSAISGCTSSFDMCELACAQMLNQQPFSMNVQISDKCSITRNGTIIKPIDIKKNSSLANPFNLDANCRSRAVPHVTERFTEVSILSTGTPTSERNLNYP